MQTDLKGRSTLNGHNKQSLGWYCSMNLLIYDNIVIIFHQNGLTIEFHSQTQSLNNCEDKGDSCSDRVKMKKKKSNFTFFCEFLVLFR